MGDNKTIDHAPVLEIMDQLEFFKNFSPGEKRRMAQFHQDLVVYQPGEFLIQEGDSEASSFFILVSGVVTVIKGKSSIPIAQLHPGDFFGEMSFVKRSQRIASVVAGTEVQVIRVNTRSFEDQDPAIREKIKDIIINKLMQSLDQMNNQLASFSLCIRDSSQHSTLSKVFAWMSQTILFPLVFLASSSLS